MYTPYVTPSEYEEYGFNDIPADVLEKFLTKASHQIDSMTFNRIVDKGFDNLTAFQQDIIKRAVCDHANFIYENEDALSSVIDSYSINGVSMKFGDGMNITTDDGVTMEKDTLALLKQTGLCCRLAV